MQTNSEKELLALNPRLKKIAELVPKNSCTADIGTDHAYIPILLVQKGITKCAIASDIKCGPLQRAEANIRKYGLSSQIETRLGSGLCTLSPGDAEVIIVAGMGGILISDILEASRRVVNSAKLLVLQPMTAAKELREYLSANGYEIKGEYLEAEEEKLYNIILAAPKGETAYTEAELYLGKGLDKNSPQLFSRYKAAVLTKLNRRVEGLKKSKSEKNKKALKELQELLEILNKEDSK